MDPLRKERLHCQLTDLIARPGELRLCFQPILRVDSSGETLWGLEALTRGPARTRLADAEVLFALAHLLHEERALDRACLHNVAAASGAVPPDVILFFNVDASSLDGEPGLVLEILEEMQAAALSPGRLVVELVVREDLAGAAGIVKAIDGLKSRGVRIALDDVGTGMANMDRILAWNPDFLKLDRCVVQGLHGERRKRLILRAYRDLGQEMGAALIAEGVEAREDLAALAELGVSLVQGHLLSRPLPATQWWARSEWESRPERTKHGERRRYVARSRAASPAIAGGSVASESG